jgi:hypothetical protein
MVSKVSSIVLLLMLLGMSILIITVQLFVPLTRLRPTRHANSISPPSITTDFGRTPHPSRFSAKKNAYPSDLYEILRQSGTPFVSRTARKPTTQSRNATRGSSSTNSFVTNSFRPSNSSSDWTVPTRTPTLFRTLLPSLIYLGLRAVLFKLEGHVPEMLVRVHIQKYVFDTSHALFALKDFCIDLTSASWSTPPQN